MMKQALLLIGFALGVWAGYGAASVLVMEAGPRLIGHECEGAGGDLWAAEESDFPTTCGAIERSY